MSIRVTPDILESKGNDASSLAAQLKGNAEDVRSIYNSLDSKVRSRQGIDSKIRSLIQRIENAENKMYNISSFLKKTAEVYNQAEIKVVKNSEKYMELVGAKIESGNLSGGKGKELARKNLQTGAVKGSASGTSWFKNALMAIGSAVVGVSVSLAKDLVLDPFIDGVTVASKISEEMHWAGKNTVSKVRTDLEGKEKSFESEMESKFVSNEKAYFAGKVFGDAVSTVVGIKAIVEGVPSIIAGVGSIGCGTALLETGIGEIPFYIVGAGAIAVGGGVAAYGGDVFKNSLSNFKDDLASFIKSESGGNAVDGGKNSNLDDFDAGTATNKQKGNFGEIKSSDNLLNNQSLKDAGYDLKPVGRDAPSSLDDKIVKGIDGLYENANSNSSTKYVIDEAKFGSSQLGTTKDGLQMSDDWLKGSDRILKAVDGDKDLAYEIKDALDNDQVERVLSKVDSDGNVVTYRLDSDGKAIGIWP